MKDNGLKRCADDCANANLRNKDILLAYSPPSMNNMSPTVSPTPSPIAALPPATFYVNGHKASSNNTTAMCIITHTENTIRGINGIKRFNGLNGTSGHTNGILTTEKINGLFQTHKVNGLNRGGVNVLNNPLRNSLLCRSNSLSSASSSSSLSSCSGTRSPGCSPCSIPLAVVTANNTVRTQNSSLDSAPCTTPTSTYSKLHTANSSSCTSINSISSCSSSSSASTRVSSSICDTTTSTSSTIRFPYHSIPRCNSTSSNTSSVKTTSSEPDQPVHCRWTRCGQQVMEADLPGHIQRVHVESQTHNEDTGDELDTGPEDVTYRCQWEGCKVFNKPSSSLSWLRSHVLVHSGAKPLCCIFEGCGERFKSRIRLQQHVSKHLKTSTTQTTKAEPQTASGNGQQSGASTPSKNHRRKRNKRRGTTVGKCFTNY